jgi:hypothetical protein
MARWRRTIVDVVAVSTLVAGAFETGLAVGVVGNRFARPALPIGD